MGETKRKRRKSRKTERKRGKTKKTKTENNTKTRKCEREMEKRKRRENLKYRETGKERGGGSLRRQETTTKIAIKNLEMINKQK